MNNNKPLRFGLIGAGGFVAPRHMKAIKETGNELIAALDLNDSVGIIDSYFPEADFFIEPERFDRHLDKLRRTKDQKLDYVSICSPNYLHDAHVRMALRNEAHAICEKPLVLNPWNVDALEELQKESGKQIYTILQLRYHPEILKLKKQIEEEEPGKMHDIELTYITSRGRWYFMSWKGNKEKSGSVATNIGIHFFDMLSWIFGKPTENIVHLYEEDRAAGFLQLEKARVRWFLSVNSEVLPEEVKKKDQRTFRSITCDGDELEFSGGFTDLHTVSYQEILKGNGYGPPDARQSINIVHDIRNKKPIGLRGDYHPMAR